MEDSSGLGLTLASEASSGSGYRALFGSSGFGGCAFRQNAEIVKPENFKKVKNTTSRALKTDDFQGLFIFQKLGAFRPFSWRVVEKSAGVFSENQQKSGIAVENPASGCGKPCGDCGKFKWKSCPFRASSNCTKMNTGRKKKQHENRIQLSE